MKIFLFILALISIPIVVSIFAIMAIYDKNSPPTSSDAIYLAQKRLKVSLKNPKFTDVIFFNTSKDKESEHVLAGNVCGKVASEYSDDMYSQFSRFIVPILITNMNGKQGETSTIYLEATHGNADNFQFAWDIMCKE
jgi:hypothetical protein